MQVKIIEGQAQSYISFDGQVTKSVRYQATANENHETDLARDGRTTHDETTNLPVKDSDVTLRALLCG
jgi:hypothetical protein